MQRRCPFLHKAIVVGSEYPDSDIHWNTCGGTFSIAHGGKNNIECHLQRERHTTAVKLESASQQITGFFRQKNVGSKEAERTQAEGIWAFHTVNHNQSFASMDCTSKLIRSNFKQIFLVDELSSRLQ